MHSANYGTCPVLEFPPTWKSIQLCVQVATQAKRLRIYVKTLLVQNLNCTNGWLSNLWSLFGYPK